MTSGTNTPVNIDVRGLVRALVSPTSHQQYQRDQQTLTDCFKEPGLFLSLQELAADRSLSRDERLLASVVTGRELKNKWRSKVLVPEARKPQVRERLFSFLEEEDAGIARPQLGLLVAVARIELPKHFPNLPQLLLNPLLSCLSQVPSGSITSSTATVLIHTLWTINALVKEWKTVKLTAGAEVMKKLEETFVGPVGQVLEIWSQKEGAGENDGVIREAGRYAFKILARFCSWHWSKAKGLQSEAAAQTIRLLVQHTVHHAPIIQQSRLRLIAQVSAHPSEDINRQLRSLAKHLRAIGKWWRIMIALDPKGFCNLEGAISGIGWWWGEVGGVVAGSDGAISEDDSDNVPYPKRFLLLGMMLFKDILPILAHDHQNVFTPEFILSAFRLVVTKLLPLTSTDLEELEEDPEDWVIKEGGDEEAWAFEFRPCAERVLIALTNACRHLPPGTKVIEPEMLKLLVETEATPPVDMQSILRREAVYCAMGRLSRALQSHGGVDFEAFLRGASTWLGQPLPILRILKRRLAWLIGQYASTDAEPVATVNGHVDTSKEAHCVKLDITWQILTHLLTARGESTDKAVQITAALAIKDCVDLWDVQIDYFLPHLQPTTAGLIELLAEAETLGGKRHIMETIGVIIDRTGDQIMPFLPDLARAIPGLWHGASTMEGEWLFKASLVVLTTKLVSAAKESSGGLMDLVIPLIEESLVPPAKEFFEEDGLALWQAGLYNAASPYQPTAETGLIRLLPGLLNILSENMDLLKTLFALLDSYLLLDAPGIVQNYGEHLCKAIAHALSASAKNSESILRILSTVALLIRLTPLNAIAPLLIQSEIFQHIIIALEDDKASGMILASYLEILARIILADPQGFLQIVFESARVQNKDAHRTLEETLDAFWRNFDYVGEPRRRKAVAMAAGALLTTGHSQCFERLDGEFMNIFLDVLGEVQDGGNGTGAETTIPSWKEDNQEAWGEIEGRPEGHRRAVLEESDPAVSVPLKGYIINALTEAHNVGLGPYWEKADAGTKNSLQKFLS